jgi:hypothetical protein
VCGPACRAARDRKLSRARRRREIEDYRADERERQRQSRQARRAKAHSAEARSAEARSAEANPVGHAPASAAKPRQLPPEVVEWVERAVDRSRASLMRDLRRFWPSRSESVAASGEVSRASFGGQVMDSAKQSGTIMDGGHA